MLQQTQSPLTEIPTETAQMDISSQSPQNEIHFESPQTLTEIKTHTPTTFIEAITEFDIGQSNPSRLTRK